MGALIVVLLALPAQAHSPANGSQSSADVAAPEVITGDVEVLTVENRVAGATHRYYRLRRDTGAATSLTGPAAESLQEGDSVAVMGWQDGEQFTVQEVQQITPATRRPRTGSGTVEQISGTMIIAHADDFASGRSAYHYHVRDDAGVYTRLSVANLPAEVRGGSRVLVSGRRSTDGATLVPTAVTVESEPAGQSGLVAKAGTVNNVLVIMANFNNTTAPSFTQSQAQQVMVSNPDSVAKFYNEVSYGGQQLNVTVTSTWVTMNLAATCDYTQISSAGNAAAAALNGAYNAANYSFVVYLFPSQGCGWAGLAYVGNPHQAFINGTGSFSTQVVSHEMGHNFGLLHAGSLGCGSVPIGGSCSVAEYGDPWDTMGNMRAMHFNAAQKSRLGWIPGSSVATHNSGSASYTLSPLETGGGSLYAVKIPTSNTSRTYWLEFRQPIGFDAPLSQYPTNGVQVRVASPFEWASGSDDTEIVDMTPGSGSLFNDSALVVGQSFLDSTYGVNIIVTGASASAVTVSVTKGGGTATTTTLASSANPSTVGSSVTFTATVTGSSPTGTVNFTDGGASLSGCSAVALAGSGNARTAACSTSGLSGGSHSVVANYNGNATNGASTSAALSQTVNKATSTTGVATSSTPSIQGSMVTFTGTVSGNAPSGSVNFMDGGTSMTGCGAAAVAGSGNVRTATCSISSLGVGTHSITAAYGGDANNNASTSGALSEVVNPGGSGGGGGNTVWVDDAVPAGAATAGDGGDGWNWVSSNPAPFSGTRANQSNVASGEHQHYFYNATATLPVAVGDTLFAYVYLDPANPPSEVMLQWNDGGWEHRAYWGANQLAWGTDGTVSRRYMGALPATGQWVKLSIPASQVGLEGRTLNGMAFTVYNGRATWDYAGKTVAPPPTYQVSGSVTLSGVALSGVSFAATNGGNCTTSGATGSYSCTVPQGWSGTVTPSLSGYTFAPASVSYTNLAGNQASQNYAATSIGSGGTTVWMDDGAPLGATLASDGGDSWKWVNSNPTPFSGAQAHQSASVNGEHQHYFYNAAATLSVGVGDTLFTYVYLDPANPPSEVMLQWNDGSWEHRAYWGSNSLAWGTDGTVSRRYMGPLPATGQWVKLAVPASQVGLEGHTLNGMAFALYNGRATWDYAGKTTALPVTIWVNDALPTGATSTGDGGDSWNWVTNPVPYSGSVAHQSALAAGEHQHYFYNATTTLSVGVGDTLFAYVYLDPANPPSEVMLQWYDGSWEHRAYWGSNSLAWGVDGTVSRINMGALPPTGQWVKLAVPAAQVGLEGHMLSGMAFALYGGRATWDYAGK